MSFGFGSVSLGLGRGDWFRGWEPGERPRKLGGRKRGATQASEPAGPCGSEPAKLPRNSPVRPWPSPGKPLAPTAKIADRLWKVKRQTTSKKGGSALEAPAPRGPLRRALPGGISRNLPKGRLRPPLPRPPCLPGASARCGPRPDPSGFSRFAPASAFRLLPASAFRLLPASAFRLLPASAFRLLPAQGPVQPPPPSGARAWLTLTREAFREPIRTRSRLCLFPCGGSFASGGRGLPRVGPGRVQAAGYRGTPRRAFLGGLRTSQWKLRAGFKGKPRQEGAGWSRRGGSASGRGPPGPNVHREPCGKGALRQGGRRRVRGARTYSPKNVPAASPKTSRVSSSVSPASLKYLS